MMKENVKETFQNLLYKQAVLDASVILDFACLKRLDLPTKLFKPPIVLAQTFGKELDASTQKQLGDMYIKGSVETIQGYTTFINLRKNFRQLSEYDCLMISLAYEKGIICCTNDGPARKACSDHGVKIAGSVGILCGCYEGKIITHSTLTKLFQMYISSPGLRLSKDIIQDVQAQYSIPSISKVIELA